MKLSYSAIVVMPANPKFNVIMQPQEVEALKKYANAQNRSLSNLVASILRDWLAQQENK